MDVETFLLETPSVVGSKSLTMAAKRYTYRDGDAARDGVTLLMFHGLGQHKEQWEPVIEKLYALRSDTASSSQIREAWSFDWQSHGESAVLNEKALEDGPDSAPVERWASAITGFIKSDVVKGHRLVGIGYSSGTIALMNSMRQFDKCPYIGLILVEPSLMDEDVWNTHKEIRSGFEMVTKAVMHRRNTWESKEAARKYFLGRSPYKSWDPRIVELFVEYALKNSKDNEGKDCVVRACPTIHEASAFMSTSKLIGMVPSKYRGYRGSFPSMSFLERNPTLCQPKVIHDCAVDEAKGRKVSSITRIPGGHTILQVVPGLVASTISNLLDATLSPEIRGRL
ncbi:alpha/beta-hydrolase [Mycena olivaceomarginata]|nr:alpha/beta-hydrolase [Mycena olivaceomarginata]